METKGNEYKVPTYVIFNDITFQEIARVTPVDLKSWGRIAGVGAARMQRLWEQISGGFYEHL